MLTVYGIPNCDSVKKARNWLEAQQLDYSFEDLRRTPPARARLQSWLEALGWETLLNRRSTTWRQLPAAEQHIAGAADALQLLQQHPTLIKRPVIESPRGILCGFDAERYRQQLT